MLWAMRDVHALEMGNSMHDALMLAFVCCRYKLFVTPLKPLKDRVAVKMYRTAWIISTCGWAIPNFFIGKCWYSAELVFWTRLGSE